MSTKTRVRQQKGDAGNGEMREDPAEKPILVVPKYDEQKHTGLIQAHAYSLWERAGKPDGDAAREQFWCAAEQEIMASQY